MMDGLVEQARQCSERLNRAVADESVDAIRCLCEQLRNRSSGTSRQLTTAATSLLKALDAGGTVGECKAHVQHLVELCADATDSPSEGS